MPHGIESLIPKKGKNRSIKKSEIRRKDSIFWIEIKKIKPNPLQPRKEFNKKYLKELASSIEKYGILQPLIAKKIQKKVPGGEKVEYQLIAGERRLKAAKMVEMKEVPVIIEEIKREEELPISLVENLQRENLNPLEKANAFKRLIEEFNLTQKEAGKIVGKSREAVSNALRILELPEEIKNSIKKEEISEGHAKALLAVKEEQRMKIFREIIEKKLPVREVEKKAKVRKKEAKKEDKSLQKLQDKISKALKIKKIKIKKTQGKIELTLVFQSKKELDKFLSTR